MTDIGKPHRVMTKEEYDRFGVQSPHIVHWNYDGFGNVAWWPIEPVLLIEFDRGKDVGKAIGWAQAKTDT